MAYKKNSQNKKNTTKNDRAKKNTKQQLNSHKEEPENNSDKSTENPKDKQTPVQTKPSENEIKQQARQQAYMDFQRQQQEQAQAIEQKNKEIEHKVNNQQHDTEFSEAAESNEGESLAVIGETEVSEAYKTLIKYRQSKSVLENRIAENEKFWRMNHWDVLEAEKEDDKRIKPKSGWLFNTIINKHADAMDNYPDANILPRTLDDEPTAKTLSQIIPVILEQNDYEQTYSDTEWYKVKNGTGVQGGFWNNDKQNGLGDVDIRKIDIMNLYWKQGISDIEDSPNVFYVEMMDNDEVKLRYPDIKPGISPLIPGALYENGNTYDQSEQTAIIDWYYKKRSAQEDEDGIPHVKTILHYCKFCNGQVIYASENDPRYADRGWYDHGQYPFVFDTLFPVERSICGMGYIDIIKDNQLYIDKLRQAILENAAAGARPRYAVNDNGALNEEDFLDLSKPLVHFSGNLGENDFRQIITQPLSNIYETVYTSEINQLKDTSGNTAASQGQASSVTSASGIASLQEAAGKLSRDSNTASYRAYRKVVYLVIELIRQFYDEPRVFRITNENGQNDYVTFSNEGLQPQSQGQAFGIDLGERLPIVDIEVKPQKRSQYSKETQNQTALNLYGQGFFAPANADAALSCLEMMDFDEIEKIKDRIKNNQTLLKTVQQLGQLIMQIAPICDQNMGTNYTMMAQQMLAPYGGGAPSPTGSIQQIGNGSLSKQAANATRNSTAPK